MGCSCLEPWKFAMCRMRCSQERTQNLLWKSDICLVVVDSWNGRERFPQKSKGNWPSAARPGRRELAISLCIRVAKRQMIYSHGLKLCSTLERDKGSKERLRVKKDDKKNSRPNRYFIPGLPSQLILQLSRRAKQACICTTCSPALQAAF